MKTEKEQFVPYITAYLGKDHAETKKLQKKLEAFGPTAKVKNDRKICDGKQNICSIFKLYLGFRVIILYHCMIKWILLFNYDVYKFLDLSFYKRMKFEQIKIKYISFYLYVTCNSK